MYIRVFLSFSSRTPQNALVMSHHFTGRKRTTTKSVEPRPFLSPPLSIQPTRRRWPIPSTRRKRVPLGDQTNRRLFLSSIPCLDTRPVFLRPRRRRQTRHSNNLAIHLDSSSFFTTLFFTKRERERKVKSPGGKFLLLFLKVFLSFLLSSMIVEREKRSRGISSVQREREREKR